MGASLCRCQAQQGSTVGVRCLAGNTLDWARAGARVLAVVQLQPAAAAASTLRVLHAVLTSTRVKHPGLLDDVELVGGGQLCGLLQSAMSLLHGSVGQGTCVPASSLAQGSPRGFERPTYVYVERPSWSSSVLTNLFCCCALASLDDRPALLCQLCSQALRLFMLDIAPDIPA